MNDPPLSILVFSHYWTFLLEVSDGSCLRQLVASFTALERPKFATAPWDRSGRFEPNLLGQVARQTFTQSICPGLFFHSFLHEIVCDSFKVSCLAWMQKATRLASRRCLGHGIIRTDSESIGPVGGEGQRDNRRCDTKGGRLHHGVFDPIAKRCGAVGFKSIFLK